MGNVNVIVQLFNLAQVGSCSHFFPMLTDRARNDNIIREACKKALLLTKQ